MWQRYRARRPVATHAFWWPHAPIGTMRAGAKLAIALPFPSVVRWGRDGWQRINETASIDSNLAFHVAVLDTAALPPDSRVNFTWRRQDNGEWSGRDITVMVRGPEAGGPVEPI